MQSSRLSRFFAALVAVSVLASCNAAPPRPVKLPAPNEVFTVGPGDVFEVYVYEEPSLSRAYKVAPNGTIDFPLIGTLEVDGKEPQQVAELLKQRLRDGKILKNPFVSVLVKEVNSKKVAVFGQVQKPGQFPMTDGLTVVQAISLAGGFTQTADPDRVSLTRKISKEKAVRVMFSVQAITEGKTNDVPLQAGDTIFVGERSF
jgi:polysaccharide export outer membrane protein